MYSQCKKILLDFVSLVRAHWAHRTSYKLVPNHKEIKVYFHGTNFNYLSIHSLFVEERAMNSAQEVVYLFLMLHYSYTMKHLVWSLFGAFSTALLPLIAALWPQNDSHNVILTIKLVIIHKTWLNWSTRTSLWLKAAQFYHPQSPIWYLTSSDQFLQTRQWVDILETSWKVWGHPEQLCRPYIVVRAEWQGPFIQRSDQIMLPRPG